MDNPLLRRLFGEKVRPGENYRFWDHYAYGFSEPCRDLLRLGRERAGQEADPRRLRADARPKRDRLLIKITGWPRIGYLNEIFEDAKFIHVLRDGRAVASSLLHVGFWRGWYGPQGWRAGLLSPEDQAVWESYDRSFAALAGLEWRIQMRAMDAARAKLDPKQFFEVKYEDFCEQPVEHFRRVLDFVELPESRGVRAAREGGLHPEHEQSLARRPGAGPADHPRRPVAPGPPPVRLRGCSPGGAGPADRRAIVCIDSVARACSVLDEHDSNADPTLARRLAAERGTTPDAERGSSSERRRLGRPCARVASPSVRSAACSGPSPEPACRWWCRSSSSWPSGGS